MSRPIYVVENTDTAPRKKLFRFLGVDWMGTPYWWISPLWIVGAGVGLAFWTHRDDTLMHLATSSVLFAIVIAATVFFHSFGHWIGGTIAGNIMTGNLLTATVPMNVYDGKRYPSRIHFIRGLGGPLFNLFVALCGYLIDYILGGNVYIIALADLNLLFCVFSSLPIRSLDGGVFLRELRNWRKE